MYKIFCIYFIFSFAFISNTLSRKARTDYLDGDSLADDIFKVSVLSKKIHDKNYYRTEPSVLFNRHTKNGKNCILNINYDISTHASPLFINVTDNNYLRPNNSSGLLQIEKGQEILLACPGRKNKLKNARGSEAKIVCEGGNSFKLLDGSRSSVKSIECNQWPSSSIVLTGRCAFGNNLYQVGFNVSFGFLPLFEFCHDLKMSNTLYTKHSVTKYAFNGQVHIARPNWSSGKIYTVNVDSLYKRKYQREAFEKLLKSGNLAEKYIQENNDYFLSRGHMVAKSDFFYGAQQVNTFYYSNAAPQWQTFNGQNWKMVERAVQKLSATLNQDLSVYTGTFGSDILPDVNNVKVKLSLDVHGKIPVPMMYWKIIQNPKRNLGVAVIGLNSPYLDNQDVRKNILCPDICNNISWLEINSNDRKNVTRGYLYCCDIENFQKRMNYIPNIKVAGVLT